MRGMMRAARGNGLMATKRAIARKRAMAINNDNKKMATEITTTTTMTTATKTATMTTMLTATTKTQPR